MISREQIAEQHLLSLWTAVREATALLDRVGGLEVLNAPHLSSLLKTLAVDSRKLAALIEARQGGVAADAKPLEPVAARPKVLLVDDDAVALSALSELLSGDFELITTGDSVAVPQLVRDSRVDAVLTDLHMPGLDGLALIDMLRREPSRPPVLLMSAALDDARQLQALELGAFDVLQKPLDLSDLTARLHRAVAYGRELAHQRALQGTDELTGLLNRRAFKSALALALQDRRSFSQGQLALAMIDQDGLKQVNDRYGHAAGDDAICRTADALKHACRGSDLAARLGGDEFALLMPGTDRAGAEAVLARITDELARVPLKVNGGVITLSVSWGIATAGPEDRSTAGNELLERADAALYEMKSRRRSVRPAAAVAD